MLVAQPLPDAPGGVALLVPPPRVLVEPAAHDVLVGVDRRRPPPGGRRRLGGQVPYPHVLPRGGLRAAGLPGYLGDLSPLAVHRPHLLGLLHADHLSLAALSLGVRDPERLGQGRGRCPNPKVFRAHFRKRKLTIHTRCWCARAPRAGGVASPGPVDGPAVLDFEAAPPVLGDRVPVRPVPSGDVGEVGHRPALPVHVELSH